MLLARLLWGLGRGLNPKPSTLNPIGWTEAELSCPIRVSPPASFAETRFEARSPATTSDKAYLGLGFKGLRFRV